MIQLARNCERSPWLFRSLSLPKRLDRFGRAIAQNLATFVSMAYGILGWPLSTFDPGSKIVPKFQNYFLIPIKSWSLSGLIPGYQPSIPNANDTLFDPRSRLIHSIRFIYLLHIRIPLCMTIFIIRMEKRKCIELS